MLTEMLRFISNYPISRRLIVAFTLAALLPSLMIAFMGTYYINQLNSRGEASQAITNAQRQLSDLGNGLQHMYTQTGSLESQVLNDLLTPNAPGHQTVYTHVLAAVGQSPSTETQYGNQLTRYQSLYDPAHGSSMQPVNSMLINVAPDDDTPQIESNTLNHFISSDWPRYQEAQDAEISLLQQIETNPSRFTAEEANRRISSDAQSVESAYNIANTDWTTLVNNVNHIRQDLMGANGSTTQPLMTMTAILFLLNMALVISGGILVLRSITGPLTELVSLTRRISKGDTNARAQVESNDEISIVASAMNNMLENIVHLIQNTQAQRDVLQGQVEKLVSEVSGVGEGDLRVQAEVTADALGVLADSFNYMVEELGSLVVRVKMVAREVEESTTMTSDRMNELVETADRQIQKIGSAGLEIERMAINSQQVAARAMALASSAREARISAQGGRQAVQQTIEGMGRINHNVQETSTKVQTLGDRSREINNIVEAISAIAHQTNRLALDAAIQAAMAGENGKGFGAVAADIRRLAERAKEQATSVGRIVRSVRDDIGAVAISMRDTERETSAGAKLAEEAGTSLELIFTVIEQQAREIDIINQMAMQQQQSSNEVVQIMQTVSESTQESTNSTRGAAQNMERVARLAEQLLASVEAFKLREDLNYFAPNAQGSSLGNENTDNLLTASNHLRTVTATVQPVSNGGILHAPPSIAAGPFKSGGNFVQYPRFASDPLMQNNGQQLFLPPGSNNQQFVPPQGKEQPPSYNGQFPFQAQTDIQQSFPSLDNWNADQTQRPFSGNWQEEAWPQSS